MKSCKEHNLIPSIRNVMLRSSQPSHKIKNIGLIGQTPKQSRIISVIHIIQIGAAYVIASEYPSKPSHQPTFR